MLQDPQEPAYFYTRSLFQDGKKAKDILIGNKSLRAVRKKFPDSAFIEDDLSNMIDGFTNFGEHPYVPFVDRVGLQIYLSMPLSVEFGLNFVCETPGSCYREA